VAEIGLDKVEVFYDHRSQVDPSKGSQHNLKRLVPIMPLNNGLLFDRLTCGCLVKDVIG
jgi:hypothetical protein